MAVQRPIGSRRLSVCATVAVLEAARLPDVRPVTIADSVDNDRFLPLLLERLTR